MILGNNSCHLRTNTQASITAFKVSQQKLTESQKFITEYFENCKSNRKNTEDRAKSAETKIVKLNALLQSLQEILREEQNKINNLEQYGRGSMVKISNISVKKEESMKSVITTLAAMMNLNNFSYDNDVDVARRLNSKLPPPLLIVMFCSRTKSNEKRRD